MLNFSKFQTFLIYFILVLFSFFALLNFQSKDKIILDKKVNLGLDLQGGSYLLLEIDTKPLIKEKSQSKLVPLKKFLKKNELNFSNFRVEEDFISFVSEKKDIEKIELLFFSKKENEINPYIEKYNTHDFNLNDIQNAFKLSSADAIWPTSLSISSMCCGCSPMPTGLSKYTINVAAAVAICDSYFFVNALNSGLSV